MALIVGTDIPVGLDSTAVILSMTAYPMKLLNFELGEPCYTIHLVALGFFWDLHNAGEFLGLRLDAANNSVVMEWNVSGHPSEKYSGCRIIFKGLRSIRISPRDAELPLSEDSCVAAISKVISESDARLEFRVKEQWADQPFNLWFEFQSGRSVEINAETAELDGLLIERAT